MMKALSWAKRAIAPIGYFLVLILFAVSVGTIIGRISFNSEQTEKFQDRVIVVLDEIVEVTDGIDRQLSQLEKEVESLKERLDNLELLVGEKLKNTT